MAAKRQGPPDIRGTTEATTLTEPFGEEGGGRYYQDYETLVNRDPDDLARAQERLDAEDVEPFDPDEEGLLTEPLAPGQMPFGDVGPEQQGNLRLEDEQFYPDVEEFVGPQPPPPGFIGPGDAEAEARSKMFNDEAMRLLEAGDEKGAEAMFLELDKQLAISNVRIKAAGMEPKERAPNATYVDWRTEIKRLAYNHLEKRVKLNAALKELDWAGSEDFLRSGLEQYRERNKSRYAIDTSDMDPMQLARHRMQMEPIVMDPLVVADQRHKLAQIDAKMKEIDPSWNVFSHPMTAKIATWIARESETSTGFIQPTSMEGRGAPKGVFNEMMLGALETSEAYANFPLQLVYGGMNLVGWTPPSNYIEGEDGKLYTNAGKVPGITEITIAVKAKIFGEDVARALGRAGSARAWETAQTNDFQKILRGSAATVGMLGGFGKVAGGFMGKGQQAGLWMMSKGLQRLPQMGERGTKIISLIGGTFGAAAGQGLAEGIAFNQHEGFYQAFKDGAKMAPIIMAIGAGGKWTEKAIRSKTGWRRRAMLLAGGAEGLGFTAINETMQFAVFDFIQDPNESTLMRYAQAMIGFGIFKGMAKRSAVDIDFLPPGTMEGIRTARGVSRGVVAKKVSEVEEGLGARELTREESDEAMRAEGVEPGKAPPAKIDLEADLARARRYDKAIEEEMRGEEEMRRAEEQERTAKPKPGKPPKPADEELRKRSQEALERRARERVDKAIEEEMRGEEEMRREEGYPETLGTKEGEGEGPRPRLVEGEKPERLYGPFKGERYRPPKEGEVFPPKESKFPTRPIGEPPPEGGKPERPPTAEEAGRELERLRQEDEAEAARPLTPEELHAEVQRLGREGATPENRQRVAELLEQQRGKVAAAGAEAMTELGAQVRRGQVGPEKAPVTERQGRRPTAEEIKEHATSRKQLQRIAKAMGAPYDLLKRYGDALRVMEDFSRSAEERMAARRDAFELAKDLDISEISQDPVMSARLRQAQAEEDLRQLETPKMPEAAQAESEAVKAERQEVDPTFGERYGPDSMRRGANPYRQQEDPGDKMSKEEETYLSYIHQIMRGKQDKPGIRWFKRRFGAKKGSEVQIAMHAGHMGRQKALGLFKVFENLIQTQEGLELVVNLHEWGHSLQRQLHAAIGGGGFWTVVDSWRKGLPPAAQAEIPVILENYPRWQKLTKKEQAAEAFAEWIVRDVLGEETLEASAPAFSREMNAFLARHPRFIKKGGQYYDLKKNLAIWKEMGSRRRMGRTLRRAGFEFEPYDRRELQEVSDAVIKAFFDDKIELKKSQERWLKRSDVDLKDLTILQDPSRMIDTLGMTAPKEAESYLKNGPHDLAWRKVHGVQSFYDIIKDVAGDTKGDVRAQRIIDFIDYIYGTRALEKFEKAELAGKKFSMPIPKSDYVRGVADILALYPEFVGKATALKAWSDSLVDLVVEGGNLTFADATRMKEEGTVYIPFVRLIEGGVSRFSPGRGVAEGGTGVKRMKEGGTWELEDPMKAMEDVTTSMIVKARKNQVVGALYGLSLHADVGGLVTLIPRANVPKDYRIDQVIRQIQEGMRKNLDKQEEKLKNDPLALGELRRTRQEIEEEYGVFAEMFEGEPLSDTLITLFAQKDLPIGEKDPIIAYTPRMSDAQIEALPSKYARKLARQNNGKMVWMKVDRPAFEALMSIGAPMQMISDKWGVVDFALRTPAQFLRFFATDANPTFTVANLIRDVSSASVFSRDGKFEPLGGLRRVYAGAAMQLRYGTTPRFQKLMEKMKKDPDPTRRAMYEMFIASGASTASFYNQGIRKEMRGQAAGIHDQTRKAIDKWTSFWTTPESWIRLGEYERVFKRNAEDLRTGDKEALEVGYEALEAAKEITVNFARAGDMARWYNQMTPYFAAGLAGQRKLIRAVLGMEGRDDEERGRLQRAAMANGLASITLPVLANWWWIHDEDWYKDLPQWRKSHFLNMKLGDTIISLPLPFELGMLFGSIPMAFMDNLTDSNPNEILPMLGSAMFPYFTEMSSMIPQAVKPIAELTTGYDFFRGRDITPYWTEQSREPKEQMRGDTSRTAQLLWTYGMRLGGNPIELEHFLGGYTAGFSTSIFRAIDEVTGLKDHPGMSTFTGVGPFINRFLRQTPHGASRTVNDMRVEGKRIGQISAKNRTSAERRLYTQINRAQEKLNKLRRSRDAGLIDKETYDEQAFEISNRIMDKVR